MYVFLNDNSFDILGYIFLKFSLPISFVATRKFEIFYYITTIIFLLVSAAQTCMHWLLLLHWSSPRLHMGSRP